MSTDKEYTVVEIDLLTRQVRATGNNPCILCKDYLKGCTGEGGMLKGCIIPCG